MRCLNQALENILGNNLIRRAHNGLYELGLILRPIVTEEVLNIIPFLRAFEQNLPIFNLLIFQ